MNVARRMSLAIGLIVISLCTAAPSGASECLRKEVEAHVRDQFSVYGPRSVDHEYFGFVYLHDGIIGSAVVRSRRCQGSKCVVDSAEALRSMPRSAKVLGEWHSHPHDGSAGLSREDVRGAHNNRHISCYLAFYSTPEGEIYSWDPKQVSVPVAMASRAPLGNYNEIRAAAAALAHQGAGL
jgi:proteasome lid subunit RPN8/RPN11